MLEQALTPTRLVALSAAPTPADLDAIVAYAAGTDARVCAVIDRTPFAARDALVSGLRALHPVEVLDRVVPDPRVEDIMAMADPLREFAPQAIVALGGGSTLDSAKALSILATHEGDLEDYLGPASRRVVTGRGVVLIAVPTTAGTGSEVTRFGVYTARGGRKHTLAHAALQPDIAVLAPALTHSLPPPVTASTGIDALSHALEAIWNRNATPVSDRAAIGAAVSILEHLPTAHASARAGGVAGRAEMLEAACRAGTAFNRTGTAMVHALSFILSEQWHVPHGTACAFTLEDAMRLNAEDPAVCARLARIAEDAGHGGGTSEECVARLVERILTLKRALGLPFTFRDLGVELGEGDIERLFARAFDDPKMRNNAVPVDPARIYALLRAKR